MVTKKQSSLPTQATPPLSSKIVRTYVSCKLSSFFYSLSLISLFSLFNSLNFQSLSSGRPMSITNRSIMNDRIRGSLTSLTASLDLPPVPHSHGVPAPNQGTYLFMTVLPMLTFPTVCLVLSCLVLSCLVLSCIILSCLLSSCQRCHVTTCLVLSYPDLIFCNFFALRSSDACFSIRVFLSA